MKYTEKNIKRFVEDYLRPKVRVDGGDIEFEKLKGNTISIGAYANCATCPASSERLKWWIAKEFKKAFAGNCTVVIVKHLPYYSL